MVLLAMGFVSPRHNSITEQAGVELDARGNAVKAPVTDYATTVGEHLRLRRHASRPVAGGLGDPRGPSVRPGGRQPT
jgi:hypothetical protein